ncbi:unnamed protein product [Aspergillus niger]|nr:unnamed protein product [Aspergillus niger]
MGDTLKDPGTAAVPTSLLDLTPEEIQRREVKLVRKIDMRLLIMMLIMYILNYLDRNNIAAAKLAGLQEDLDLRGDQYQVCVSILFVGYLLMQVPSNLILNKLGKPSIYLPGCMVAWGVISCCTAATHNFAGLIVVRFLLGFVEAAYFIFVALIAFFIVPDLPRTTTWLTDDEKVLAAWRLEKDIGEDDWVDNEHQSMTKGAKLAVTDIKTWLMLGVIYGCTSAGCVTTFFPSVMAGLGRNNIDTLLLTTPPYLIATLVVLVHAWNADRTGERYLHISLPPVVAIVAFILAMAGNNFAARYVAMCIMLGGIYAGYVVSLGYISNILPRPAAKRAAALAFINCLSNVCQIYMPYLYPDSASPRYIAAFSVNIALLAMTIVIATILRIYLGRLNKQLDELEGVTFAQAGENEENGLPGRAVAEGFRFLL